MDTSGADSSSSPSRGRGNEPGLVSRRQLIAGGVLATAAAPGRRLAADLHPAQVSSRVAADRFDPWVEIDEAALFHNVRAVARLVNRRPVLAVVKNNAYGLGLAWVGPVLDRAAEIVGLAVIKPEEALALREAGVRKPILVMARVTRDDAVELVRRDIRLAFADDDAPRFCRDVAARAGRPVAGHLYVDTGMHRMGLPVERAVDVIQRLAAAEVRIEGSFTELTEDRDFDRGQADRLREMSDRARARGLAAGSLHAASTAGVMHQPETYLDLVRPGFALYGGYVSREAARAGGLRPAFRLRARVVRVERVEAGEGVSYHRRWRAGGPTWVATLPVGHVDGYPAEAVKGCEVLIGGRPYPVVGTVSASHTLVAIGPEPAVQVGDAATLVGPDHPAVHPDTVALRSGTSEYGVFFRLNPLLPRGRMAD